MYGAGGTPIRGAGLLLATAAFLAVPLAVHAQGPRARDLGVPFEGDPGPLNAITDVGGVEVGHTTLIRGSGPKIVGQIGTAIASNADSQLARSTRL